MEPFKLTFPETFSIEPWIEKFPHLTAGFTTRDGGVSNGIVTGLNFGFHVADNAVNVKKNREILSDVLGFPLDRWVGAEQIHDVEIKKVTRSDSGKGADSYATSFKGTDGFFTDESSVLMTMCFADCVPLFFVSPEKRLLGVAHAGWKGSVGDIAGEMVSVFSGKGADPAEVLSVIGPSICEKCYVVDERVIKLVENILEGVEKNTYNQISEGQYALDLKELNRRLLIKAGLKDENILVTKYCTSCSNELFYSHRKEKSAAGRMMAFIGWKEDYQP